MILSPFNTRWVCLHAASINPWLPRVGTQHGPGRSHSAHLWRSGTRHGAASRWWRDSTH